MSAATDLSRLERAGWEALASSSDEAAAFYGQVLGERVLMLLPGGLVVDDRSKALDMMRGAPWSSFALFEERVVELTTTSAVIAYRCRACRSDDGYEALVASTYVLADDAWRLVVHQQTPV